MSNNFHKSYKTIQQKRAAAKGLLCPYCLQTNEEIKDIGYCLDGFNLNIQYKCTKCNKEWEGN